MEIVITIERDEDASSIAAYSENPNITVVRDASVSNRELLAAYADALESHEVVSDLQVSLKK